MGLVDYSESESSDAEVIVPSKKPPPKSKTAAASSSSSSSSSSKTFQPVVDNKSGKIKVSLAGTAAWQPASSSDEPPPAKRARTTAGGGGGGGGKFSGFNSFLPPPKNPTARSGAALGSGSGSSSAKSTPGFGLRTSAAPGFSRDTASVQDGMVGVDDDDNDGIGGGGGDDGTLSEKAPKSLATEPSIPEGQKPASQVKLTGKPLMFRPLSVANGKKKKTTTTATIAKPKAQPQLQAATPTPHDTAALGPELAKKKSLFFPMPTESSRPAPGPSLYNGAGGGGGGGGGAYEPLFEETDYWTSDYAGAVTQADTAAPAPPSQPQPASIECVGDIANEMNLSAAARRELFGRSGGSSSSGSSNRNQHDNSSMAARRVVNFNMDREYEHNEALRASGEQQTHNPVRSIQGGGKHSLRQLVSRVQGQKEALVDSFAKGRSNRKEASSRYGW